jgi:hypothetical protein
VWVSYDALDLPLQRANLVVGHCDTIRLAGGLVGCIQDLLNDRGTTLRRSCGGARRRRAGNDFIRVDPLVGLLTVELNSTIRMEPPTGTILWTLPLTIKVPENLLDGLEWVAAQLLKTGTEGELHRVNTSFVWGWKDLHNGY